MSKNIELPLVGMKITLWARGMSFKPKDFTMGEEIILETEFGYYRAEVVGIASYGPEVAVRAKGGSKP